MGEVIKKMKSGRFIGWYLRFVDVDGQRKQRASRQPSFAEARRMLVEIEARIARGRVGMPERNEPAHCTIERLVERFITEYDSPRIKDHGKWAAKLRITLRPVLEEIGGKRVASFDAGHAERLRNRLIRGYAANTARAQLAAISAVFAWAVRKQIHHFNPLVEVKRPKPSARLEFLSRDEATRLIDAADALAKQSVRHAVLAIAVRLSLYAGLRAGEVFGLRWRDVDLDARSLTVARSYGGTTKSGRARPVPIADELGEALRDWRAQCPATTEGVICPVIGDRDALSKWHPASRRRPELTAVYRAAGLRVPASPWHALRHTFASLFVQSGGSILTLQQLLGHADIKLTLVYSHLGAEFIATEVRRLSLRR